MGIANSKISFKALALALAGRGLYGGGGGAGGGSYGDRVSFLRL